MKTKANVYLVPTDKPTCLFTITDGELFLYHKPQQGDGIHATNQHLYITIPQSDLEISKIKEGDWFITDDNIITSNNPNLTIQQCKDIVNKWIMDNEGVGNSPDNCEKIIACSDTSLNQNIVAKPYPLVYSIPQSFINNYIAEYNKSNVIKSIGVELEGDYDDYYKAYYADTIRIKLTSNNEISIIPPNERMYSRDEVKELCFQSFINYKCVHGKIKPSEVMDLIEPFNEWVKNNLNT